MNIPPSELFRVFLASYPSREDMIRAVLECLSSLLSLDVFIASSIRGETYTVLYAYDALRQLQPGQEFSLRDTYCEQVYRRGAPLVIEDAASVEKYAAHPALVRFGLVSYAGVPVLSQGQVSGTLVAAARRPARLGAEELDLLKLLAQKISYETERDVLREELRLSEEKYRNLFERATDAIYIVDLSGRVVEANRAGYESLGRNKEELLGRSLLDFVPESERLEAQERCRAVAQGQELILEVDHLHADGSRLRREIRAGPAEIGGERHIQCIARDLTERRNLERKLLIADRMAALGQLVAGVAHEINNPVGGIYLYAANCLENFTPFVEGFRSLAARLDRLGACAEEALATCRSLLEHPEGVAATEGREVGWSRLERSLEERKLALGEGRRQAAEELGKLERMMGEFRTCLQEMMQEAIRTKEVVSHLLSVARQTQPQRVRTSLNQLVREFVEFAGRQYEKEGVAVEVELAPDLPDCLLDPQQIQQVLLNLGNNAVQAMKRGGRLLLRTALAGRQVLLSLTDTGAGIDLQKLEHIFDPFYTTRAHEGGTGLGLSVTHSILQMHGAEIGVESKPGGGTTVSVLFPAED